MNPKHTIFQLVPSETLTGVKASGFIDSYMPLMSFWLFSTQFWHCFWGALSILKEQWWGREGNIRGRLVRRNPTELDGIGMVNSIDRIPSSCLVDSFQGKESWNPPSTELINPSCWGRNLNPFLWNLVQRQKSPLNLTCSSSPFSLPILLSWFASSLFMLLLLFPKPPFCIE